MRVRIVGLQCHGPAKYLDGGGIAVSLQQHSELFLSLGVIRLNLHRRLQFPFGTSSISLVGEDARKVVMRLRIVRSGRHGLLEQAARFIKIFLLPA